MKERYIVPKTTSVERTSFVENYVQGKDILHVGVGGAIIDTELKKAFLEGDVSQWFHAKISRRAKSVTTLEIERDNIEKFSKIVPGTYIHADITDPRIPFLVDHTYELIVFTEIIEHLDCFRSALQNINKLLAPGGQVLISTVNAFNASLFLKMMFRYETNHIEHTAYFSYLTIKRVLEMNGLVIRDFRFAYDRPRGFAKRWVKMAVSRIFPQFSQAFLVIAERSEPDDL